MIHTINIIELFGESDSDEAERDLLQPNPIEACIWEDDRVDSPLSGTPYSNTGGSISHSEDGAIKSLETTPMDIAMTDTNT